MYKKILVPLDGSPLAEKALDHAIKLSKIFDSEIILFQVVHFMPIYGSPELVAPLLSMRSRKNLPKSIWQGCQGDGGQGR